MRKSPKKSNPKRRPVEIVTDKELLSLVSWPEGSVGFMQELTAVTLLNNLCINIGYGRMGQIMDDLEGLWRDPEKIKQLIKGREQHLKNITLAQKSIK
jgi:hypothetical protein